MRDLPPPEDEVDAKTLSDIKTHGWHVMMIDGEDDLPGWVFSMGLYHTLGHPEVAIFGLPLERMHAMVNLVGELVRSGQGLHGGAISSDILEGYDCVFRDVAKRWYQAFFGYARWLYRGDDFPLTQCVWPDRNGYLPDDPRCHAVVRDLQPRLNLETEEAAGVRELLRSME